MQRDGSSIKRLAKMEPLQRAVAGMSVSPAPLEEEVVRRMAEPIRSDVRPAGWLASQPCMMESLEEMPTLGDASTKIPSS